MTINVFKAGSKVEVKLRNELTGISTQLSNFPERLDRGVVQWGFGQRAGNVVGF